MITEDYVSFEVSKLLKEKGFDYVSFYCYEEKGINDILFITLSAPLSNSDLDNTIEQHKCYSIPTLQMAMKWLREVHYIFIRPNTNFLYPIRYYCEIFCYGDNLKTQQDVTTENFESPEEACEAAIKYCLKNLI